MVETRNSVTCCRVVHALPILWWKYEISQNVYVNKYSQEITEQYYMHEEDTGCILDEICMPFVIGAGDATENYIGEYAEKWNKKASRIY